MGADILNKLFGDVKTSQAIEGLDGKVILIYGPNKCGKSYNAAKAPKPLFLSFENGLTAMNDIPYIKIRKWSDFRKAVKLISDPANFEELHKQVETIVVDAVDGIEKLSNQYVCGCLGINAIREYNSGYGAWKEWADEIDNQLRPLVSSGFTVVFLGHEGERKFKDEAGVDYTMIYPRGDKRAIDPILNYVDITGYVRLAPADEAGNQPLSTLYLKGNRGFFAGSRFMYLPKAIPEWSWEKFDKAVCDGIKKEVGQKGITAAAAKKEEDEETAKIKDNQIAMHTLKERIGAMVAASMAKIADVNHKKDEYNNILLSVTGSTEFKVTAATEAQREQVEGIYQALLDAGYSYKE